MGYRLDGNSNHIPHFDKGRLPPVDDFWSVTAHDSRLSHLTCVRYRWLRAPATSVSCTGTSAMEKSPPASAARAFVCPELEECRESAGHSIASAPCSETSASDRREASGR